MGRQWTTTRKMGEFISMKQACIREGWGEDDEFYQRQIELLRCHAMWSKETFRERSLWHGLNLHLKKNRTVRDQILELEKIYYLCIHHKNKNKIKQICRFQTQTEAHRAKERIIERYYRGKTHVGPWLMTVCDGVGMIILLLMHNDGIQEDEINLDLVLQKYFLLNTINYTRYFKNGKRKKGAWNGFDNGKIDGYQPGNQIV